jgi:magnesium-transporting ATPase (P-type)
MGTNVLGTEKLPLMKAEELEKATTLGRDYGELCRKADGFAQVFPEHKYLIVEALRQQGMLVGMTGDGVNDAPALKRADVGIAVQGATSAAQAAADIVLTEPGLSTIVTAIVTSRKIFQRMKNFVIYRVACTEQLLFFFFISCIFYHPNQFEDSWPQHFAIPVIALVTITILNDGTIISVAYDNVHASMQPEKWDLNILYIVSSAVGLTALASSVLLLSSASRFGRPEQQMAPTWSSSHELRRDSNAHLSENQSFGLLFGIQLQNEGLVLVESAKCDSSGCLPHRHGLFNLVSSLLAVRQRYGRHLLGDVRLVLGLRHGLGTHSRRGQGVVLHDTAVCGMGRECRRHR